MVNVGSLCQRRVTPSPVSSESVTLEVAPRPEACANVRRALEPVRLGQHELLIRLAAGGAANVFLVRDTSSPEGRLLALKILLPSLASNEDFLKMFFTEAKIAAQLQHDNIVGIAGFGQVNGIYCLAMEYIFGASLAQVLRASARAKRPLTVGVLLRITSEVCDALHYAHEMSDENGEHLGLVHRDVTPQNILIGFNGSPKLTDFGIAKATNRGWETQAGIVKGKFSYMSPEQALGKNVDRRSDIFGAGIVLWEALTGRDLFKGSTPMEVLTAIREQKIEPPSKVVPGLTPIVDPIVMKALRRSPRQRYQTGAEMRDDIEDLIRRAGVSIDAATISKELATIYSDDIAERAFALRTAMAGKADPASLAKALGGSVLEPKHLPEFQGGLNDPDPLGLFSGGNLSPDISNDFGDAGAAPVSDSRPPAAEFDMVEEPVMPSQDLEDDELVPFGADADELVPHERAVNGWEDGTAMNQAPSDDLLSMLSEEDATIGFLPPEFAERFGRELQQALEDERADEEVHFDDEATIGIANSPVLAELRAISEDATGVGRWAELAAEARSAPLPATGPLHPSYGLRAVPRAPSVLSTRPAPRAPSLDIDRGLQEGPARPSRPLPPPPPPAPSSPDLLREERIDDFDAVSDTSPPPKEAEVLDELPIEDAVDHLEPPLPSADLIPPPASTILPPPNGELLPSVDPNPLAPEALKALAEDSSVAPSGDQGPAAVAVNAVPEIPPLAQVGVRVSPAFLIAAGLLLVVLGAAIGIVAFDRMKTSEAAASPTISRPE